MAAGKQRRRRTDLHPTRDEEDERIYTGEEGCHPIAFVASVKDAEPPASKTKKPSAAWACFHSNPPAKSKPKVKFVMKVDYLWENVRRNEVEVPDFVYEHDEDLEYRPMMDYGLESDHTRVWEKGHSLLVEGGLTGGRKLLMIHVQMGEKPLSSS